MSGAERVSKQMNERTSRWPSQYFRQDSWLFWTIVHHHLLSPSPTFADDVDGEMVGIFVLTLEMHFEIKGQFLVNVMHLRNKRWKRMKRDVNAREQMKLLTRARTLLFSKSSDMSAYGEG